MAAKPMTLLVVADGLRPSVISESTMPYLCELAGEGTQYRQALADFPSLTRPNAATIATGCTPAKTGIFGNYIWSPDFGRIDTSDPDALRRLRSRGALPTASLAQHLSQAGRRPLVVGNGSAGCTYLLNPGIDEGHGAMVTSVGATSSPFSLLAPDVEAACSPPPESCDEALEWAGEVARASIAAMSPDLLVFWSGQPDIAHHDTGLSSAASSRALARADAIIRELHSTATRNGRECDIIVTADHGFCGRLESVDVNQCVANVTGLGPDGLILALNCSSVLGYFDADVDPVARRRAVEFITRQSWSGPVFCADSICPGSAFPFSVLWDDDASSLTPDLIITMATNAGYPLRPDRMPAAAWQAESAGDGAYQGLHGSVHPDDMHVPLILHGPSFRRQLVQERPAGLADIAPTVFAISTGRSMPKVNGRVLTEALANGGGPLAPCARMRLYRRGSHEIALRYAGGRRYLIGGGRAPVTCLVSEERQDGYQRQGRLTPRQDREQARR